MGIRLTDMLGQTAETVAEYAGEEIAVCYYPNAVTIELSDRIDKELEEAQSDENASGYDFLIKQLVPIIVWWDVLDDKDKRLEPSADNMRKFPLNFLTVVMDAITNDQAVDKGEAKGSDGGS